MLLVTSNAPAERAAFREALGAVGAVHQPMPGTWLVDSLLTPAQAYALLEGTIDRAAGDRVLVIEVNPRSKQGWLPKATWDWVNARLG